MEKIALITFLACALICTFSVLFGIWLGEVLQVPEWFFKLTATVFIVGLANFLVWFVHIAYRFRLESTSPELLKNKDK